MTKVWQSPSIDTGDIAETYSLGHTDARTEACTDRGVQNTIASGALTA